MNRGLKRIARDRFERLVPDEPPPPPEDLVVIERRRPLRLTEAEEGLDAATRAQAHAILDGSVPVPGHDVVERMGAEGLFDVPKALSDEVLIDAQAAYERVPRHATATPPRARPAARSSAKAPALAPRRGRKLPFDPDPQQRRMVEMMAAMGVALADIANCVTDPRSGRAVTVQLLRRMFERELSTGTAKANVQVASKLFLAASSCATLVEKVTADGQRHREVEISPAGVQAAMFWLRSRGGFKPTGGRGAAAGGGGAGASEALAARADSARSYAEMDLDDLTRIIADRFSRSA